MNIGIKDFAMPMILFGESKDIKLIGIEIKKVLLGYLRC